ncbi:MAG TPA: SOS response-associated peptidase [Burkholderiaceae bacterium]|jgi:putative SOS response-associated peptidase YedK|nr:SOS response-associated peptidase [Burkholderiaceae bacterium]
MCGRYDLSESPAAIRAHFGVPSVPEFVPRHDVRPTERAPIIRINPLSGKRESSLARWGLTPAWAKDLKFGARCINARIETFANLAAYRAAYRNRRCLVPASAFFEWSGPAGQRTKWRIRPQDEPLFGLAGLWERWIDPHSGERVETYTIVTTAANGMLAPLHDRMPVIVASDRYDSWLDTSSTQDLFVPVAQAGLMVELT